VIGPSSEGDARVGSAGGYADEVSRAFLVRTYAWMFVGLGLTATVAVIFS